MRKRVNAGIMEVTILTLLLYKTPAEGCGKVYCVDDVYGRGKKTKIKTIQGQSLYM